jgi:hypothetical protein
MVTMSLRPFTSPRKNLHRRRLICPIRAASLQNENMYVWQELEKPSITDEGRLFTEDVRIRSHEVGPNQQSSIVTVSNLLQVRDSAVLAGEVYTFLIGHAYLSFRRLQCYNVAHLL